MEAIIKKLEELRVLQQSSIGSDFTPEEVDKLIIIAAQIETLEWVLEQDFGYIPYEIIDQDNLQDTFIEEVELALGRKLTEKELDKIDEEFMNDLTCEMFEGFGYYVRIFVNDIKFS